MSRQLDKGRRGDNAWPLWGLVMRLVQAVSVAHEFLVRAGADTVRRWVCTGTVTDGTYHAMSPRRDARYPGNAMPPIHFRHIASQGRMYPSLDIYVSSEKLKLGRSAINPEHCDTAFPSEPLKPNGEKSYSIVRFELSQLSSE